MMEINKRSKETSNELKISAVASLPTKYGNFKIYSYEVKNTFEQPFAVVMGEPKGKENVPVRLHSECVTGDVFGSLRCDCGNQLQKSMQLIAEKGLGVIIYLRQEGRGIGINNKVKAYCLQDQGFDTVEANHMLGFGADERDYVQAGQIIRTLEIKSIQLITNNPEKISELKNYNVEITSRIPIITPRTKENAFYLETKKKKMHHMI